MRNKLALIIALASFAVVTALGVGLAGADPLPNSAAATRSAHPRPPAPSLAAALRPARTESTTTATAWSTLEDPDCESPADTSEAPEAPRPTPNRPPAPAPAPTPAAGPKPPDGGVKQGAGDRRQRRRAAAASPTTTGPRRRRRRQRHGGGVTRPERDRRRRPARGRRRRRRLASSTPAAPRPPPTRRRRSRPSARRRSASPTSSSTPSRSRPSCCRSTRPAAPSTGSPGRCSPRSTKSRPRFGTNLNVSSAGAVGWMQFLPSSWETYGLDANGDGRKDPYNPVDAICAAAHYLKVAGGDQDLYKAIFAYNHADWYVQEVLALRPRLRQAADRPGRLADRADRGRPLPGRRRRPLRRRHLGPRGAEALRRRGSATTTATPPK